MVVEGRGKKLSAYVGEADTYDDKPLYQALVEQARIQGCAGATVLRGVTGYGATSRAHGKHALRMSVDLPVVVLVIDEPIKITALAEVWSAMVLDGLITVEDTGLGITPEELPQVFERFYRGTAGHQSGAPGTGLGLAICKEIIDRLGGRITVKSEPGQGTRFTVWLKTSI